MSSISYSFLDVRCSMIGPGGSVNLGNGSGASEEEGIKIVSAVKNKMETGADSTVQHSLIGNKSGTFTISLLKTSKNNAILDQMYNIQTSAGKNHGQNTLSLAIPDTGEVITLNQVAFSKRPDLRYASEAGMNEWEFDAGVITSTLGDWQQ